MSFRQKLFIAIIATICGLALWAANDVGQSGATESPTKGGVQNETHLIDTMCVGNEVFVLVNFENAEAFTMELTITVGNDVRTLMLGQGQATGEIEYPLGVSYTPGHVVRLDYKWIDAPYEYQANWLELLWPETNCGENTTTTTVVLEPTTTLPELQLDISSQTLVCTPEVNAVTPCGGTPTTTVPQPSEEAELAFTG